MIAELLVICTNSSPIPPFVTFHKYRNFCIILICRSSSYLDEDLHIFSPVCFQHLNNISNENLFDRNRFIVTILGDYIHNICKWHVCGILWHNKLFRFCTANEDDELSHWTDTKWHYPDRWMTIFDRWAPDNFFFLLSITFWSIQKLLLHTNKATIWEPKTKKEYLWYLKMNNKNKHELFCHNKEMNTFLNVKWKSKLIETLCWRNFKC